MICLIYENLICICQLPEERKVGLLKNLAECSPYTAPQDARLIFPSVIQLLKVSRDVIILGSASVSSRTCEILYKELLRLYKIPFTSRGTVFFFISYVLAQKLLL